MSGRENPLLAIEPEVLFLKSNKLLLFNQNSTQSDARGQHHCFFDGEILRPHT